MMEETPAGHRPVWLMTRLAIASAAALLLAAPASAQPQKSLVWQKITAAYTAQAKAHGYTADCTKWNRVVSMHCTLSGTTAGMVFPAWKPDGCTVTVSLHATTLQAQYVDVNTCKPQWWTRQLPTPWAK